MNLQHVADFLDLVKDPQKYEQVLKRLQDEQARLNAAIETVGKASELDKLRKEVEVRSETLQKEFEATIISAEKRLKAQFEVAAETQAIADKTKDEAEKALANAQLKLEEAKALGESFDGRDKALRKQEEELVRRQAKLDSQIAEYNDRLNKLRSVMA